MFDETFSPIFPPDWKDIDVQQCILQAEESHRKIRQQLPRGPNYSMRSEVNRLKKTLLVLDPFSTWSPKELAVAGFYGTGLSNSSQCFCCGLVLCRQSLSVSLKTNHQKFNPSCEFTQSIESGNISKYDVRPQPSVDVSDNEAMESEDQRLQSFTTWPAYAMIEPTALAQTCSRPKCSLCFGSFRSVFFFFRFISVHSLRRDHVQCFSSLLGIWVQIVNFPPFIYLYIYLSIYLFMYFFFIFTDGENKIFQHHEDVKALTNELIMIYNDTAFRKSSPFGNAFEISIDLKSLFADVSVTLKDTKNQPVQQLSLPDILSILSEITMIEGEAGSGKSALLKKIAILWASGTCPILSRFSLVFYISVSSIENQQSLSQIIQTQVLGHTVSLREEALWEIIKHLGNKVLFLVDDYSEMDIVPKVIEELLLRNPSNRLSLAVAVRSGMGRKLRQYARTVLRIEEFPLYSTLYLLKKLFSDNIVWLQTFLATLEMSKSLQATLKTPLMGLALCSYRSQNPNATEVSDTHIFKVYLMYHMIKFPLSAEKVKSLISSCGELALKGLVESCFDFTDDDLSQLGIESEEAIRFGLLNKYTAQRLRPRYRFFHPSFQEFVAGKRLSELLESENQDVLDKGFHYLSYIDTFLKIVGRYHYLLKYALRNSAKATVNILTHLFSLYDSHKALDCQVDSKEHLQRHPELEIQEELLTYILNGLFSLNLDSHKLNLLLTFAVEAGIQCQFLSDCAPKIKEFLTGKMFYYDLNPVFTKSDQNILLFIESYPESISLLSGIQCTISPNNSMKMIDFSSISQIPESFGIPSIESEYLNAFLHLDDLKLDKQKKLDDSNKVLSLFPQEITISDALVRAFSSLLGNKAPVCHISASCVNKNNFPQSNCEKMKVLFSVSDRIKLTLSDCSDFILNNWPAIQVHLDSFRGCTIQVLHMSEEEQRMILSMSSLESLNIYINDYCAHTRVVKLRSSIYKTVSAISNVYDACILLLSLIAKSPNCLAAETLKNFTSLEVLNLVGQKITDRNVSESLAVALGSLDHLKTLHLSGGTGMLQVANLVIGQLQNLHNLQFLTMAEMMDDESIVQLAKAGYFRRLRKLELHINNEITESGWREFFQTADNLPELSDLDISRIFTHQIKCHATTVTSFVRFVSRLRSVVKIIMYGWLLDEGDVKMFNAMKENHPQASSLILTFRWVLPFSPKIEN
uniref:NACHT domain-containing protein n=1 Tax=Leptobrachium leishanense TaxID=445787 RepID=A0A8C5LNN6_9ANUR